MSKQNPVNFVSKEKEGCQKCLGTDRIRRGELSSVYCPGHDIVVKEAAEPVEILVSARLAREGEVPGPCKALSTSLVDRGVQHRLTYAEAQQGARSFRTVALRVPRYGVLVYQWQEDVKPKPAWRFELALMITDGGVRKMGLGQAKAVLQEVR